MTDAQQRRMPPPPVPATAPITDAGHQLPPHQGKLDRIQSHVQGAIENLRAWVELRVELVQREVELKLKEAEEKAKFGVIMGVLAALAGLFLLLVLGFGFAALFELIGFAQLPALTAGFGLVTLLLAIGAGLAYLRSPFSKD